MELTGKVAFITGSANGIGKGYAEALLQKGAKVFLNDINETTGKATLAEFETKFGSENVRFMKLDVSNEEQFEEVFKAAVDAFGQVDIMVNNAGVMDESAWRIMIKVNIAGVVIGTKLAEQHMRKDKGGKGGRIINISSNAGLGDYCILPVYCATKHAVRSLTMSQAGQYDLAAQGIEYAALCPNPVETDLITKTDTSRVNYYDLVKDHLRNTMPVSCVVDAFMELLQLENMNAALLKVEKEGHTYQKVEIVDQGPNYTPALTKQ